MKKRLFILLLFTAQLVWGAEYFQQHVSYQVQAKLHHLQHRLSVSEKLIYTNHSPDTLSTIWFHLYFNKFRKGAFTEDGVPRKEDDGYLAIDSLHQDGRLSYDIDIDHTLMSVNLNRALAPGDSICFDFDYHAQLPHAEGRYGFLGDHNDVGNWLIVPVVYDRDGWHLHQHIDSEFYQEWGDFDVALTVPRGFIVGASGDLLNADSALRDTAASIYQWRKENPHDTLQTTLWQYRARNVTDFAWTTDPDYRYYSKTWQGITVNYLIMRANYAAWKKEIGAGLGVMRILSQLIGPYPYKQITVADTYIQAGGMEYPNIVFINTWATPRRDPAYFRAVVIHEIAHNWFYGLLASNQTEFEWQDEGFTQFAEIVVMEKLYGRYRNLGHATDGLAGMFYAIDQNDRDESMYHYLRYARSGREIDPINTMPDRFRAGLNIAQYDKMATVLAMLEDVLGTRLFWQGMQNYYKAWNHKHPQPHDFIRTMEQTAGRPLKWFFDEWIYEVRTLDLAVDGFRQQKVRTGYAASVNLENKSDISMPFDLLFVMKNGDSLRMRVPVQPYGRRISGKNYLPYWHFSNKKYTVRILLDHALQRVVIDPDGHLADIDRRNNSSDWFSGLKRAFMRPRLRMPALDAYSGELWPSLLYNDPQGVLPGLLFEGSYLNSTDFIRGQVYFATRTKRFDFRLRYRRPLTTRANGLWHWINVYDQSGLRGASYGWEWHAPGHDVMQAKLQIYDAYRPQYLAGPWQNGKNILADAAYTTSLWNSALRLHGRSTLSGSDFDFSLLELAYSKTFHPMNNALTVGLRLGAGFGNTPVQEQYNLAGANALRRFENPWYRSKGALPVSLQRNGHAVLGETARVRGAGLNVPFGVLNGKNLSVLSMDLELPSLFDALSVPFLDRFENYFFADFGAVWQNRLPGLNRFYKSAGISLRMDMPYWATRFSGLRDVQMDFPVWMDYPEKTEKSLAFRWQFSLEFALERTPFFD